jgi:L-threonylcarbamoyladenylate synthase
MAGTGCVGVRVPSHPVCHRLLEFCGEPIAAPSANLFGHVSPTTVNHVQTDLGSTEGLLIIEGGDATIGIESTVIKIKDDTITILRPGFVTELSLSAVLPGKVQNATGQNEKLASPGHETKHYAPNVKTVLATVGDSNDDPIPENAVIVDFNRTFASASARALRYMDLSPTGSVAQAISRVYSMLREVESVAGVEICVIADVTESGVADEHDRALVGSLRDRLLRSASHILVQYRLTE